MSRILAIDFGLKRCGLAVTDELGLIASPLETVSAQDLDQYLSAYMTKESVSTIVIGLPLNLQGKPTPIVANVHALQEHLTKKYPLMRVALHDERFTSKMASSHLHTMGMKKSQRKVKGNVDMTSAALILQGYMRHMESMP